MAHIRVVVAVRYTASGNRVDRVMWGVADTTANKWHADPSEAPVIEVVDAVLHDGPVYTAYTSEGHAVMGPRLRVIADAIGVESIETAPEPGNVARTVAELPRF